jgi:hypothetical protein
MSIPRVSRSVSYPVAPREARAAADAVPEAGPSAAPKPRLLDRVRDAIRALPREGVRQLDPAGADLEVELVLGADRIEVPQEIGLNGGR